MKVIDKFDDHENVSGGEYAFLSNFYQCPVNYDGLLYPSSEHAYQAAKTLNMKARLAFTFQDMTPAQAKHLGQALSIRRNWDGIKLTVMADILASKFSDWQLKKWLLETDDAELIEGNTWNDTYWGVCNGKGQNWLGKLLMSLRTKLKNEQSTTNC